MEPDTSCLTASEPWTKQEAGEVCKGIKVGLLNLLQQSSEMEEQDDCKCACGRSSDVSQELRVQQSGFLSFRYNMGEKLGSGGFGTVYTATRTWDALPVAIKVVKRSRVKHWEMLGSESVPREAVLLHRVRHVLGVCHLLDIFRDESRDSFLMVLERPPNCVDLFDFISESVMLCEALAVDFARQMLDTLDQVHWCGVYHRDVKDENILVDLDTMTLKLIDFGSGAFVKESEYTDYEGTRVYCPPEWLLHRRYHGVPLTIWSIGVLLYDMLCGDVPFERNADIIKAQLTFPTHLSQEVVELITSCLTLDPSQRPSLEEVRSHKWFHLKSYDEHVPEKTLEATRRRLHPASVVQRSMPVDSVSRDADSESASQSSSKASL